MIGTSEDGELAQSARQAYLVVEIHFDVTVYPDPLEQDPARCLLVHDYSKRAPYDYIGSALERHPCCMFSVP